MSTTTEQQIARLEERKQKMIAGIKKKMATRAERMKRDTEAQALDQEFINRLEMNSHE